MAAKLIQADYNRAVKALTDAGITPQIIFDTVNGTVTVTAADKNAPSEFNWKDVPDRV